MVDKKSNKPKNIFIGKKIKFNKYKIIFKSAIVDKEKYNGNKKNIFTGNNSDNNIKINRNRNLIHLKRNSNNYISRLNKKYMKENFKSSN